MDATANALAAVVNMPVPAIPPLSPIRPQLDGAVATVGDDPVHVSSRLFNALSSAPRQLR